MRNWVNLMRESGVLMKDKDCIKYRVYNSNLYDRLVKEYWGKETPTDIKDYMIFCYHYEEYRTYGEV